jgi:hypothetical protein
MSWLSSLHSRLASASASALLSNLLQSPFLEVPTSCTLTMHSTAGRLVQGTSPYSMCHHHVNSLLPGTMASGCSAVVSVACSCRHHMLQQHLAHGSTSWLQHVTCLAWLRATDCWCGMLHQIRLCVSVAAAATSMHSLHRCHVSYRPQVGWPDQLDMPGVLSFAHARSHPTCHPPSLPLHLSSLPLDRAHAGNVAGSQLDMLAMWQAASWTCWQCGRQPAGHGFPMQLI